MSEYAVMPKADYAAACDAIRDKTGGTDVIKSGEIPAEIDKVFDKGYDEGFLEGEEQGYDDGYTDGWDFGENSGTEDGFKVGVGMGEDVQVIMVGTVYESGDFNGTYPIDIENPKQIVITVTDSFDIYSLKLIDANGSDTNLADPQIQLEAGTYTFDFPDGFVCNADDGYREIYLEGFYEGIVGVSVTNRPSYDDGYAEGVEAGKQAEYDLFWDALQDYGNRGANLYDAAFAYWGCEYITPKYPLVLKSIYGTFLHCEKLKEAPPVTPEGDGFVSLFQAFAHCYEMESIPFDVVIKSNGATANLNQAFIHCRKLKSLKLVLDGTAYTYGYAFTGCYALEDLIIEGEINSTGMDLGSCSRLNNDSFISIMDALSSITSGKSITVSKTAVDNAFETSAGAADGSTSAEWLALVATKSNWTISLV